jgi:hypothetical protein
MLQDKDHMEASCIIYVKVGLHVQLDQWEIHFVTVTTLGIAVLTMEHYLMIRI